MISLKGFGKNDIRGIYGKTVTEELMYNTGKAYVYYVRNRCNKLKVILSVVRDVRLHSKTLTEALIGGITEAGGDVVNLGMGPTPFGYYSEFIEIPYGGIDGALIVTASHNPPEYNGLKMTCKRASLKEEEIREVKEITERVINGEIKNEEEKGKVYEYNMVEKYIEKQKEMFGTEIKGVKIVTDCANAAAGVVAPQMLKECGYEVVELYTEPDGHFPNHHPNPSIESTLDDLKKKVKETQADAGIAFDGDADRIGVIDSEGNYLTGDKLLYIYAQDIMKKHKKGGEKPVIVSEVKCSQALYDGLKELGAEAVMCKTGHGYIKAKMKETKAVAAGEMSGHMFFNDEWYGFDDAIYSASRLAYLIYEGKKKDKQFKLRNILKPFEEVYTSSEVRYPCADEEKKIVLEKITEAVEGNPKFFGDRIKEIIKLDGMRIVFDGGFAMIRQSNTEPVFTLRFEGKTKEICEQYQKAMISELELICENMKGKYE